MTYSYNLAISSEVKTIILTKQAAKDLDALPAPEREATLAALDDYAIAGTGDVKALSDRKGYRLRVGNIRILFNEDLLTIVAIYIGRRSTTTYKRH